MINSFVVNKVSIVCRHTGNVINEATYIVNEMELINLCHPSLKPVVNCSHICSEGYEVHNLISKDLSSRRKGFMSYHTIKPPVDVTIEFICHAHVSHVIIWPQVGCQKSSAFEILSVRKPNASARNARCNSKYGSGRGRKTASSDESASCKSKSASEAVKIGYGCINDEPGIVFYNTKNCSKSVPPNFRQIVLHNSQNLLQNIKLLKIRIVKTRQSSVPAIGAVEIWGSPSKYCSKKEIAEAMQLWSTTKIKGRSLPQKVDIKSPFVSRVEPFITESDDFQIPEDFIDPITCEVMVSPIVLPSGKVVDESTLERHRLAEEAWGRSPSDPFTGRIFTSVHKPVLDVALKARLDKFLMENGNRREIQGIPRTVGRGTNSSQASANISHLVVNKNKSTLIGDEPSKMNTASGERTPCDKHSNISQSIRLKRTCEDKIKIANKLRKMNTASSSHSQLTLPHVAHASCSSGITHEEILDDSLEIALKATLSGLPTFVQFSNESATASALDCCVLCNAHKMLYQLPCKHLLCRTCLIKKTKDNELFCSKCKDNFRSCDPVKYHL